MTLKEGIYDIAEGYKAITIEKGTKVKILKRAKPAYEGERCRDCVHCQKGRYAFGPNQWWESNFCDKKPKTVAGRNDYFYSTTKSTKACNMFERKEN